MNLNVHIVTTKVTSGRPDLQGSFWFIKLFRVSNICFKYIYFEIQIFKISKHLRWRHILYQSYSARQGSKLWF